MATLGWLFLIFALLLVVAVLNNSWLPLGQQLRDALGSFKLGQQGSDAASSPDPAASSAASGTSASPADIVEPAHPSQVAG